MYANTELIVVLQGMPAELVGAPPLRSFYIAVFVLAGTVCLAGVVGARTLDHPDVRRGLGALLVLSGVWALFTALQLSVRSLPAGRAIHLGGLVAGISTIFAWLAFASAYSGRQYHRQPSLQASALALLAAIVAVKVTNPLHGLYFSASLVAEPFVHPEFSYGAPHWFVTGFAYTATVTGFLWLFESFERLESRPTTLYVLVLVTALPVIPYALSGYSVLLLNINYEPLGVAVFALGTLFYARTEFAHHSSPEQSALADNFADGGLVLDDSGIVINSNDRAATILGQHPIPRAPIEEIDPGLASLDPGETRRITYEVGGDTRTYELQRSRVTESLTAAEVITLKDVTRATRLEQLMRLHRDINEALIDVTEPWRLIREIPETFTRIDAYDLVWLYPMDESDEPDRPTALASGARLFNTARDEVPGVAAGETDYATWAVADAASEEPVFAAAARDRTQHVAVEDPDAEWERRAAGHGITDCFAVPMEFTNQRTYILGLYSTAPGGFDSTETKVIEEISESIPQAIEMIETHEEALQYEEAIRHAGVAISITDTDGVIGYVNPAFEELTGYTAEEAVGNTHRILNSGEMSEDHYETLWETILDGDVFEEQVVNKTKSGDRYTARQTISPVTNDAGEPEAFVAIQIDITEKLLREQRLSVLSRVLRHNLRTAVNVIQGYTDLLEERLRDNTTASALTPEIEASTETIRNRAEEVASQAETAREIEQVLSNETGRVGTSVRDVAETARETATTLGCDCRVDVDGDIAAYQIDTELNQIVEELVENAILHNDSPPAAADAHVTLSKVGDDLVLCVEDDGPGMSEQELIAIEEGSEEPLRHGSGLGLWKVNWLAISRGGSISATTGADGTTIRVTVPLRGNHTPDVEAALND
ncbi:PAS domain S-box protein [Halobellus ordinarius]|uniref:PAS domain S-box protein n=1 Tax=Halobellus ordinarius TaxID=3075120 RepID=UPI002880413C|nr:PAS domain S-box protein [Halobellus sp. ZY16]